MLPEYFRMLSNPSRIDAKRRDHFLESDFWPANDFRLARDSVRIRVPAIPLYGLALFHSGRHQVNPKGLLSIPAVKSNAIGSGACIAAPALA